MWEIILFVAIGVIALAALTLIVLNKFARSGSVSLDEIIGERCKVVETVDNYVGCGLVKVKGQVWSARGVDDDDIFEPGERLTVVAIEGVKLVCRKNG